MFKEIICGKFLNLSAPTPQTNCLSVFDYFVRLVHKGLIETALKIANSKSKHFVTIEIKALLAHGKLDNKSYVL